MTRRQFPSWRTISLGGKVWVLFILFGPYVVALLLKGIEGTSIEWIIEFIDWVIVVVLIMLAYLLHRWALGRGGDSGFIWRIELLIKKAGAAFSADPGKLWLAWARKSEISRLARIMFEKSMQYGNIEGIYEWGRICKSEKREDAAGMAFKKAAERGHLEATWEMGEANRWGLYWMPRNRTESRRWHEIAARRGYLPSIRTLAIALEIGDGLDADIEAAKRWQKRMESLVGLDWQREWAGNFMSIHNEQDENWRIRRLDDPKTSSFSVGFRYISQFVIALVWGLPAKFYQSSVNVIYWSGLWGLLILLIVFILFRLTTVIGAILLIPLIPAILGFVWIIIHSYRPNKALIALEKRADEGDSEAMYELGMLYRHGSPHVHKYLPIAAKWLIMAAEKDHPHAMLQAGQLLAWGYGVTKDTAKARHWLHRARAMGLEEADVHLGRMG